MIELLTSPNNVGNNYLCDNILVKNVVKQSTEKPLIKDYAMNICDVLYALNIKMIPSKKDFLIITLVSD